MKRLARARPPHPESYVTARNRRRRFVFFCFRRGTTRHPRRFAPRSSNDPSGSTLSFVPAVSDVRLRAVIVGRPRTQDLRPRRSHGDAYRNGASRSLRFSFVLRDKGRDARTHTYTHTHTHTCIEFLSLSLRHVQYCRGLSFSRLSAG